MLSNKKVSRTTKKKKVKAFGSVCVNFGYRFKMEIVCEEEYDVLNDEICLIFK